MVHSQEPDIKVGLLFSKESLQEAKEDVERFIREADDEIIEFDEVIAGLRTRKNHFQGLIDKGRFKKSAMETALAGMDVGIRKYRDKIGRLGQRKDHFRKIIANLENKIMEADRFNGDIV